VGLAREIKGEAWKKTDINLKRGGKMNQKYLRAANLQIKGRN
jgi:hypothetical protein